MKDLINHFKEKPVQATKEMLFAIAFFILWGCMFTVAGVLQSCSASHTSTIDGKAVIITTDTTYIRHNGSLKFPLVK